MSKRHRGFIDNYQPRVATVALIERVKAVLDLYADHLPKAQRCSPRSITPPARIEQ